MLVQNIITVAFAAIAAATPLAKRAVTVNTDGATASVNAQVTVDVVAPSEDTDIKGTAEAASAVVEVINKVVQLVQGMVNKDIERRRAFTQETVAAVSHAFPGRNVVTSNVGYTLTCTPDVKEGTSYNARVGSNVTFDVLVFGKGCTFTLKGNGGFENWAYITYGCTDNGKTLTC